MFVLVHRSSRGVARFAAASVRDLEMVSVGLRDFLARNFVREAGCLAELAALSFRLLRVRFGPSAVSGYVFPFCMVLRIFILLSSLVFLA